MKKKKKLNNQPSVTSRLFFLNTSFHIHRFKIKIDEGSLSCFDGTLVFSLSCVLIFLDLSLVYYICVLFTCKIVVIIKNQVSKYKKNLIQECHRALCLAIFRFYNLAS